MRYIKKPIVIEAMQVTADVPEAIWEWLGEAYLSHGEHQGCTTQVNIRGEKGETSAETGEWIIKGINGEVYPCSDDVFRKTYELVAEHIDLRRANYDAAGKVTP